MHSARLSLIFALVFAFFLAGCQTISTKMDVAQPIAVETQVTDAPSQGVNRQDNVATNLDSDTIYNYLAAEIGVQRHRFAESYKYFISTAESSGDRIAAEKAARIALQDKRFDDALRAIDLWLESQSDSLQARQLAAIIYLRTGKTEAALSQFEEILKQPESGEVSGYERVAAAIASEKDLPRDLPLMRQLVDRHVQDSRAHFALALLIIDGSEWQDGLNSLATASKLDPSWSKPVILQAQLLALHGEHGKALDILNEALAEQPQSAQLYLALGRLLTERKQYDEALDAFKKASKLSPGDADTEFAIGMLAMQVQDFRSARIAWQAILDGNDAGRKDEASYFLAQTEELAGNRNLAIALYASVKEGKTRLDAQLQLARLLASQEKMAEARDVFAKLRLSDGKKAVDYFVMEAAILRDHKQLEDARDVLKEALASYPDDLDLHYNLGLIAAEMHDVALAEHEFSLILAREPEHADTLNALGYTLADQTDRLQDALGFVQKAIQLKPDSPAIMDSLGWIYFKLGNTDQALDLLQKAATANPDGEIAAHLGEVLWMTGAQDRAADVWEKALAIDPDNAKLKEVMQRLR